LRAYGVPHGSRAEKLKRPLKVPGPGDVRLVMQDDIQQ
jgi:hypothetical protein